MPKFIVTSSSFIVGFCIHYFWLHFILYHINVKRKQKFNYIGNDSMNFIVWNKFLRNKGKHCLRVTKRRIHSPKTRRNTLIHWNICISNHFLGCLFIRKHDGLNNNYRNDVLSHTKIHLYWAASISLNMFDFYI